MNLNEVIVPEKCIFFHLQVHKQGCIFISSVRNTLPSEILTVFHINKSYIRTEVHLMADIKEKVVLAYSGGLDTTAIIPWLKETYGYDVIACCVNVGQESELTNLDERAAASGASSSMSSTVSMNSQMNTLPPAFRHTLYMKTNISSALRWRAR